jgi:hypothetical protein
MIRIFVCKDCSAISFLMPLLAKLNQPRTIVFLIAFACAGLFALLTNHAWEDYYITYRASKNLATGQGLVFNVGDRLHTFTSPLGVLLPAAASLLTFNTSDVAALWIFRMMSCLAFGGAAALVFTTVRRWPESPFVAAALAVAWLCTDAKSLDFTINGMETGFMLLFLAYALWALFSPRIARRWLHLGLAWGGLMWTRPDSFIYIGLITASAWIFNDSERTGLSRKAWFVIMFKAALVCTAVYLPWFASAWIYYGSPVPHTIVAKASVSTVAWDLPALINTLVKMPRLAWEGSSTLDAAFLPTYFVTGGWPYALILCARAIGISTACLWFVPGVRAEIRAASLSFLGAHVYLTFFPYFPFPWYLPPTTLLAFFAWSCLASQLIEWGRRSAGSRRVLAYGGLLAVGGSQLALQMWTVQAAARQMAALQTHIDTGNRKVIGEWLAAHSAPGDRVFLEPLGYIGFFSGLKTYDWPGLSSREVVEAHAKLGSQWSLIIDHLGPDWIVLRPREVAEINRQHPILLTAIYEKTRDFDVSRDVEQLKIHGRPLLEMDARFTTYHRKHAMRFSTDLGELESQFPGPADMINLDDNLVRLVHAPGSVTVNIPREARHVRVAFGFRPGAGEGEPATDGAGFQITWSDGDRQEILHYRELNPAKNAADRGAFIFDGELPVSPSGHARLILRSIPGATDTKDWTCWGRTEFR